MPPRWRIVARDLGLLFCAALLCYLLSVLLAARLGVWLVSMLRSSPSLPVRLLLSVLVLDLIKAPPLALCALGLRRMLRLSPTVAALVLLGLVYGLELLAGLALAGAGSPPALLAARVLAAGLLFLLARWIFSAAGQRPPEKPRQDGPAEMV